MKLAPIVIFAFNRPNGLQNLLNSLKKNELADKSDLYIFVDGYRKEIIGEENKVSEVKEIVRKLTGFNKIEYNFSDINKGLANSIIEGVTEVINKYGSAIVLEDDLVLADNFLSFMNKGLIRYEKKEKVFSICGYSNKIKVTKEYNCDAYFCTRSSSWGWATWTDRWDSVDWELIKWNEYSKFRHKFNKWGGSDCFTMLCSVKEGWGQSWAIRFVFAQFLQNKLSLFPLISKVRSDGFDGEGTNCKKWSRFKYEFDNSKKKEFIYPVNIQLNKKLYKSAMSYNGLLIRICSRLMYYIYQ